MMNEEICLSDKVHMFLSRLRPWSYSKQQLLRSCPYQFFNNYVLKKGQGFNNGVNWLAIHGSVMHEFLEKLLKKEVVLEDYYNFVNAQKLPEKIKLNILMRFDAIKLIHEKVFRTLKRHLNAKNLPIQLIPEYKICLDHAFQKTTERDTIFFKSILDVFAVQGPKAVILDYKSKIRKGVDYKKQLLFYAAIVGFRFPKIQKIYTYLSDISQGSVEAVATLDMEALSKAKKDFIYDLYKLGEVYSSFQPQFYQAKPNKFCDFCQLRHTCPIKKI